MVKAKGPVHAINPVKYQSGYGILALALILHQGALQVFHGLVYKAELRVTQVVHREAQKTKFLSLRAEDGGGAGRPFPQMII